MFIMKRTSVPKSGTFYTNPVQQGQEEGRFRRQTEGGGGEEVAGHQVGIIIRFPGGTDFSIFIVYVVVLNQQHHLLFRN